MLTQHVLGIKLDADSIIFDLLLNLWFIVQSEASYHGFHLLDASSPLIHICSRQQMCQTVGVTRSTLQILGKESNWVQLGSGAYPQSHQLWPGGIGCTTWMRLLFLLNHGWQVEVDWTSYLICGALCKMKIQGSLVQRLLRISRLQQQNIKSRVGPF